MNIYNMKKLRDYIAARPPAMINMAHWLLTRWRPEEGSCGTAGCIAGNCAMMLSGIKVDNISSQDEARRGTDRVVQGRHASDIAREYLCLSDEEADYLFIPSSAVLAYITQAEVLAVLDRCIMEEGVPLHCWDEARDRQLREKLL